MNHPSHLPGLTSTRAAVMGLLLSAGCALDANATTDEPAYKQGHVISHDEGRRTVDELYAKPARELMESMLEKGTPHSTRNIGQGIWEVRFLLESQDQRYRVTFYSVDEKTVNTLPNHDTVSIKESSKHGDKRSVTISDIGLTGTPSYGNITEGERVRSFSAMSGDGLENEDALRAEEARLIATVQQLFDIDPRKGGGRTRVEQAPPVETSRKRTAPAQTYQSMLNKEFTPPPALVFTVQVQSGCDLNSPETCNLQILKAAPYQDRFVPRHPVFSPTHTLTVQVGDQSFPAELSVADIVIIEGFGKDHEGAGIEKSLKQTPFNVYIEFPKGTIIQGDTVTLPGGKPTPYSVLIN